MPPALSIVGTGGAPTPTCSAVVQPGGDPSNALAGAASGSTVCLANGSWPSGITIDQPVSNTVTLAAVTPGKATVDGITTSSPVSNLTVEGLTMTEGFKVHNAASSDTFEHNTMQGWGGGDAQTDSAFSVPR